MSQEVSRFTNILFKTAAAAFALLLLLIIHIANQGEGGRWWAFIHDIPYGDKLGHIGLMGTLCLLFNLATSPRYFRFLRIPVTRVTALILLLVTLEEVSQAFIPKRNFDPLDLLADMVGLAIGQAAGVFLRNRFSHTDIRSNISA